MPCRAHESCPGCRYALDSVIGRTCPECGIDVFAERRWSAFGPPAWPMLLTLAAGAGAWLLLLLYGTWIVRSHAPAAPVLPLIWGTHNSAAPVPQSLDTPSLLLLAILAGLTSAAVAATLTGISRRRALRRAVGETRARLALLTSAPLAAAGLSWFGVGAVALLA